jgi:hypothetical protein
MAAREKCYNGPHDSTIKDTHREKNADSWDDYAVVGGACKI